MPTYHLLTYGCQMNKSDSERIAGFLQTQNYKPTTLDKAGLIILNLCSVRQSAIDRIWGKLHNMKTLKHKNIKTNKKIILTGCILPADKKKFTNKVDLILDIKNLNNWHKIVTRYPLHITHYTTKAKKTDYFSTTPNYGSNFSAYIPIMTGCNNFCSYCVVPYTRGQEKSRPAAEIINEVNKLIVQGYKFITLLGQNVNSYNSQSASWRTTDNKTTKINFPKLLKTIDSIPGNYWLSFITSHPKDVSVGLIKCFKNCKHLIPYLHLPIQAGNDKILKAMNRKYTTAKYLQLVKRVRQINPNINLSTDVIVGFPGETARKFKDTAELMKKIKFDMAYINQYSPRPGTAAEKLIDNIPKIEKKKRDKILNEILKKTAAEKNKKMIDKTTEVLVEKITDNALHGHTRNFKNIKIAREKNYDLRFKNKNLTGQFIKVKIIKANSWSLEGKLIK